METLKNKEYSYHYGRAKTNRILVLEFQLIYFLKEDNYQPVDSASRAEVGKRNRGWAIKEIQKLSQFKIIATTF